MTEDKWKQIVREEQDKKNKVTRNKIMQVSNWPTVRAALMTFINEVDKVTEVYEMENKVK